MGGSEDRFLYSDCSPHVEKLNRETKTSELVLVRGPPSSGKTTLAHAIHRQHNFLSRKDRTERSYIFLPCQTLFSKCKDADEMEKKLMTEMNAKHNLSGHLPNFDYLAEAMSWLIHENIAVIVDEAHLVFREEFPSIYAAFLKHDNKLTGLFFSTTSESVKEGSYIQHSPPELSKKFFFDGSFDVDEKIEFELAQTGVKLSSTATRALVQISGRHRGVFVRLCDWIETIQANHEPNKVCVVFCLWDG